MKYNRICQILGIEKPVIQGPGDPRFCRALFFTMNASSTVKTVMTIKLTLLM